MTENTSATEPVAYLYTRDDGSKDLLLGCNGEYARRLLELGATETPLFTTPTPAPQGEVERLREALRTIQNEGCARSNAIATAALEPRHD